ncbi:YggS family pyridoxal phosphate-dependent enzyme [Psychrobacter sp. DM4]|uniref:YggS family pyridoxal phosphate-dependent enzyme n=1 Tax=Psychrobacter sp. DM4 TaxID=3440637 RepID=UPI003F5083FE
MDAKHVDKNESSTKVSFDSKGLIERWQQTLGQIKDACESSQTDNVTLLAVSKTKPVSMIAALAEQGQQHFGENYLQEALEKIEVLKNDTKASEVVWHYIGSIQRNKTRDIAENFDWVQTLERDIIAKRLNEQRPESMTPLNVLIQLNIDNEDSKSGCLPSELPKLIASIKDYKRLCLRGLMIIPSKADTDAFVRTQKLFNEIKDAHSELIAWDTLSMGMSGDMAEAIAGGSTTVRVGTAIFGARD